PWACPAWLASRNSTLTRPAGKADNLPSEERGTVSGHLSRTSLSLMVVLGVLASVSPTASAVGQSVSVSNRHEKALLLPTPRCCMGMAYDGARGNVVVFGGQNRLREWEFRDTWTWD